MRYGLQKDIIKLSNVVEAPKSEDYAKGVATVGGAAASGAAMTRFLPMGSDFAKKHPVLRGALYAGGLSTGGLGTRAAVDAYRNEMYKRSLNKTAADMPPFLSQDRPEKVKEIYRALKREHPEYSAGKKARIANAMGKEAGRRTDEIVDAVKTVATTLPEKEHLQSWSRHSALNLGMSKAQLAQALKGVDHKGRPIESRDEIKDAIQSLVFAALPPTHHTKKEMSDMLRADHREWFRHGTGEKNPLTKKAEVEYRGKKFPGYNQPIDSDRPEKKKMVLAKKGDQVKLIHFGQKGYKHNYSDAAKKNYLTRSAGIRGKDGNLTANDKFSANYWARRELWPKNEPADGSARSREKRASDDDFGHKAELAGLGILAAPYATHLGAKVPGVRAVAKPVSKFLHDSPSVEHALELGGLGVLAIPSAKYFANKKKAASEKKASGSLMELLPDIIQNMDPGTVGGLIGMAKVNLLNRYGPQIPGLRDVFAKTYRSAAHAGTEAGIRGEKGLSPITRGGLAAFDPNLVATYEKGLEAGGKLRAANLTKEEGLNTLSSASSAVDNRPLPIAQISQVVLGKPITQETANVIADGTRKHLSSASQIGEQVGATYPLGNRVGRALTLPVNKDLLKNLGATFRGDY